ncbi:DNA cytosine methyltransferase [uncultured Oscillibacter sp.]|uniref:DNA cytosine methyltransferase n=1 Tax=uncultured Oscillibacter sp. TaxID=876091 RepID=UPI002608FFC2|nr:DNA cytosine methyltransferase [uncultured Oscillibacter sp.]
MKVLSLFDGISCGMAALERAGIPVEKYVAFEIDKYAIAISQKNYPQIKQRGNVLEGDFTQYKGFDLLIGGSPCTYWSIAKRGRETTCEGLGWTLFQEYVRALKESGCRWFLYENNYSIHKDIKTAISLALGVEPIMINSALVSAQSRKRCYWTNIPGVVQPADRGILLRDILESGVAWREKGYCLRASYYKSSAANITGGHFSAPMAAEPLNITADGKAQCLRASCHKDGIRNLVGNTVDRRTCVAEPVRIGTIENAAADQGHDSKQYRVYSPEGKSTTLCAEGGGVGAKTGLYACPLWADGAAFRGRDSGCAYEIREDGKSNALLAVGHASRLVAMLPDGITKPVYEVRCGQVDIGEKAYPINLPDGFYIIRKLTPVECERLQTLPDGYTEGVSATQRYKCLGNGWTVDVIAHILRSVILQ